MGEQHANDWDNRKAFTGVLGPLPYLGPRVKRHLVKSRVSLW